MTSTNGDVQLSVGLSVEDVTSQAKKLSSEVSKILNNVDTSKLDNAHKKLLDTMTKTQSEVRKVGDEVDRLSQKKLGAEEWQQELDATNAAIATTRQKLLEAQMAKKALADQHVSTNSEEWREAEANIDHYQALLRTLKTDLEELNNTPIIFTEEENSRLKAGTASLEDLNNKVKQQVTAFQSDDEAINKATTSFTGLTTSIKNGISHFGQFANAMFRISGIGNIVDTLKNKFQQLTSKIKGAGSAGQSFGDKLKYGIRKVLSYGLGIATITSLFNKLRSAMISGFQTMAKFNNGANAVNAALTQLTSSLNLVKGSVATAFAPLLTVVAPILSSFMQQLANVITMVGMFIAKLTGAKSYMKATFKSTDYAASLNKGGGGGTSAQEKYEKAVKKAQEKYDKQVEKITKSNAEKEAAAAEKNAKNQAKAEEKQAKAAEKLAKAQEKANNKLAAFDDLNVLGIETAEDEVAALEDVEEIQAKLAEMPELELPNLEDYLGGGGGGGAGSPFGLEEVSLDGLEWDWDYIKNMAEKLGREIADKLNKIFSDEKLAKDIGHFIAELLNTALRFAYGFIDQLDWRQMGRWLGTLIREGIETFDWGLLGHTLGLLLNGLADTVIGFFERYPVGLLGSKIAEMFNRAIQTIDPVKIGTAVSMLLKAPLIELSEFFTNANWELLGKKLKIFIQNAFQSKSLNGESLGTTVGTMLANIINAGVRFLLSLEPTAIISALITFFTEIFKSAFAGIDWWDVAKLIFGGHGLIDALITGFAQAIAEVAAAIASILPEPLQKALGFDSFMEELNLIRDGTISAFDEMGGVYEDLQYKFKLVGEGVQYNADQLKYFAESGQFTGQQIDAIIGKMQEFAQKNGESLDLAALGLQGYNGKWDLFMAAQNLRNTEMNNGIKQVADTTKASTDSMNDKFMTTAERASIFAKQNQDKMAQATQSVDDYSITTNTSLSGVEDKSAETSEAVGTMAEEINTNLEGVTAGMDAWYQSLVETYFSYDTWTTLLQDNILLAINDFFVNFFVNFDEQMQTWWDSHVLIWFTPEKWNADVFIPWEANRNKKWEELMKWWDEKMKDWWDNKVVPWFKEEKWKEQFEKVHKVAKEVAEATHKDVTDFAQKVEDFVIESCDKMIDKVKELIAELEEVIALASQVEGLGGGGSHTSSSGNSHGGSSGTFGGGSSQGGGGGGGGFMPRLEIMHFEDNLGMSAFRFPELATGAVIPPNNKFLAVLGDQTNGTNIETPLATMLDAFRTVMDEYMNPGVNNVTMELDGETFARLMLPKMMDEMHRQGYNTEIIEGM